MAVRRCGALAALILSSSLAWADTAAPASAPPAAASNVIAPPYATGDVQIVSPRGLHVATVTTQGSRHVVLLDNVAGPTFDDVLPAAATIQDVYGPAGDIKSRNVLGGPVIFSDEGAHYAYAARNEKDVLVLLDGKEIFRAPFSAAQPAVQLLRFSPDGKHTLFLTPTTDTMNSTALVVDGKPQLPTQNGAFPVWSADGAHYAYVATGPRDNKPFLVVDGQPAPGTGGDYRQILFAGDHYATMGAPPRTENTSRSNATKRRQAALRYSASISTAKRWPSLTATAATGRRRSCGKIMPTAPSPSSAGSRRPASRGRW